MSILDPDGQKQKKTHAIQNTRKLTIFFLKFNGHPSS